MAQQTSVGDLLHLLKSSELQVLEDVKLCITDNLNTERGSCLLSSLVDFYLETSSLEALNILSSVREPHDKHLLDKMNECLSKPATRLNTLILLGHIIRRQPSWIHKISQAPVLVSLLKCLKCTVEICGDSNCHNKVED
ncbi:hamartin-like [Protopterus annectens]|uniref:hamartin-like n=1 Tax=Protopterus annectens TaxID=7888 RepID=UPI001CFA450D|nr:hamartin-like [Protopterus annectens]